MQQHQHNLRDNTHVRWCTVCSACCFCPFRLSWPIPSCYSDWININFPLDKSKSTCILCVAFFPLFWWLFEYVYKCVQHVNRSNVHAFFAARRSNGKKIQQTKNIIIVWATIECVHLICSVQLCCVCMLLTLVRIFYTLNRRKKREKIRRISCAHRWHAGYIANTGCQAKIGIQLNGLD